MKRPPSVIQNYKIHMMNGETIDWAEDYDSDDGITSMYVEWLNRTESGRSVCLSDELGPKFYFDWKNVCYISAGTVEDTGW